MGDRLARAVARRSDCRLLWCVDRDLEAAMQLAAQLDGTRADDDVDGALHRTQVQAVLVATRPDSHAQLVAAAARARKHVFVEAPLATKLPDALHAHAAVRKAGVVAGVDFALRTAPGVALVRSTVPGPQSVVVRATVDSLAKRWEGEAEHGGVLGTFGSHALDMANNLSGSRPLRVYGTGGRYVRRSGLPDTLTATIKFASGGVAQVVVGEFGRTDHGGTYWGVVDDGTRRAELWNDLTEARVFEGERVVAETSKPPEQESGLTAMLDAFIDAVRGGGRPLADSADGVRAVQLADGLYEAMRLGRAVDLKRLA
ncbi:MAG: Gfo/Idh/MocA family oxidoreductase [Chloroflexi bacterium]|nr:Gfo/Idh/MocA family oxidoreductase [Chloroflexota bacterium]